MEHEWVKNPNRISPQYVAGVQEFINVAKKSLNSAGLTLCPCFKCLNARLQSIGVIRAHSIKVGIDNSYTRWVYHGEEESNEGFENEGFSNKQFDGLRAGLNYAAGDNAKIFNNEIGYIVRKNCSFCYKEWRRVPLTVRAQLRHKLLTRFDVNVEDKNVQKVIDKQIQRAWRGHRYKLHAYFKEIGGEKDVIKAKSKCHEEVSQEDWDYLCDYWTNSTYLERARKNAESRGKRKWESKNGSKTTACHHITHGAILDSLTGQIETWHLRH